VTIVTQFIHDLLEEKPEALEFFLLYNDYVNQVDDLIDEKFTKEGFLKSLYTASLLYSSNYFTNNRAFLLPIEHNIINTYADTVQWETCEDPKRKQAADVLRHCGQDMLFAIIKLEFGYEALRQVSPKLREIFLNQ